MEKQIEIKIDGKKWEDALDKAFKKANKKAKIDGFRPGHAPKEVFLKKYGKESLYMDAADAVLNDAYEQMLNENKDVELVAQPEIALKSIDEKGVTFNFTLTTRPEVKLKKYKGLKVKKESAKVTKEEINHAIDEMRSRYAETMNKENETVEDGDTAVIDFEGFKDGVAFDGGKGENYSLKIGSGTFIPGFEEQLVGMKKGDEKEIKVTFPKDYHAEDLKGKEVTFKVKVNDVKTTVIPELGEEFYADLELEGVNSKETLEATVKDMIKTRKEANVENKFIDDLIEAAIKQIEVDVPHVMIHDEIDRMLCQYEENLRMQGLTLEQFYQFTNSDEQALRDQMHEEAEKRVLSRFMLEEVAKAEKIDITDKEAEEEAQKLAEKYQMEKDEFLKMFGGLDMIKYDQKMRKAIEVLKENNDK
ncbi:MAG TPA: trigger factor [Candidatus Fimihabitans intestinipullorum]|uniref:Trigger factor n=1 Tax=Candidatus Fimihabitans intestinipullorum TaxID=2840820 RepID=A0A9D1L3U3_9BACT|nr:trigger factor [Candidatus Fimihabitans intestinipullorum]